MIQNKLVSFMSSRFEDVMSLLSSKKDDFVERTGFNKDFGDTSTNVSRGNHNHDSLYEPRNSSIMSHLSQTVGNPHGVTKSDVGLGNVDNISDIDKVLSNPQKAYVDASLLEDNGFEIQGGGTSFNDNGGISSTHHGTWEQGIISKAKYRGDVSFSLTPSSRNGRPRLMVGFTTQNLPLGFRSIEACFYIFDDVLYKWFPGPSSAIIPAGEVDWTGKDTITISLSGNMVSCHVSGRLIERIDMGNIFDNGAYIKIVPLNVNSSADLIQIDPYANSRNLVHSDTYTGTKTISSGDAIDICTFDPMLISPNKGLNISLSVPCRNASASWGGAYLGLLFQINGAGVWYSLGNTGFDGAVMHSRAPSIATANLEYALPIPEHMPNLANKAFMIAFRLIGKSYTSSTIINGSHDINRTANNLGQGTALPWATIQNFTHITVKEYDI